MDQKSEHDTGDNKIKVENDARDMTYSSYKCKMCQIECKNEINLKKH